MKKKLTIILILILSVASSYCQETNLSEYFPIEKIIHTKCTDIEDSNECINDLILKKIKSEITKLSPLYETYKDTLKIKVSFDVDYNGSIVKKNSKAIINDSIINKQLSKYIITSINNFPDFVVKNLKNDDYPSYHDFHFYFLQNDLNKFDAINIPSRLNYQGGQISKIPMFSNCKYKNDSKDNACFQKKLENHITKHFRYPKEALRKGISGVVYVSLKINENGEIYNLKTKGPDKILEDEAVRIFNNLKTFKPSTINGKPVEIYFSIPITFKNKIN